MGFVAQVFSLFRRLSDVNWASITSSTPFLKYDQASDKIVGAPIPIAPIATGATQNAPAVWDTAQQKFIEQPHIAFGNGASYADALIKTENVADGTYFHAVTSASNRQGGWRVNDTLGGGRTSVTPIFERMDFSNCSPININRLDGAGNGLCFANSYGRIFTEPACKAHFGAPTFNVVDTVAQVQITNNVAAQPALLVQAASGQSANTVQIKNSAGGTTLKVEQTGGGSLSRMTFNYVDPGSGIEYAGVTIEGGTIGGCTTLNMPGIYFTNGVLAATAQTFFLNWGGPNNTDTSLTCERDGLLRVRKNTRFQSDFTTGGILQNGVHVDAASAPAAATLGSVVKKIQAFDASGNSLGYIPVYDGIA